jgi:hypothetical protein
MSSPPHGYPQSPNIRDRITRACNNRRNTFADVLAVKTFEPERSHRRF